METITTYQIYREAYNSLLCRMERETERYKKRRAEGKPTLITAMYLDQLTAQLKELGGVLDQMEGRSYEA